MLQQPILVELKYIATYKISIVHRVNMPRVFTPFLIDDISYGISTWYILKPTSTIL